MWRQILSVVAAVAVSGLALAGDGGGTKEEAISMVERAIAHAKKVGTEQAFKDFSNKSNSEWQVKDVYLFCYTFKAVNTCHGANEKLIGKDLSDMKTPDGQFLIKNMVEITRTKGEGWIEYDWPHPQTRKVESKAALVKRIPNVEGFLGAGVYR